MPGYYTRVLRVCAEDSPNVRLALAEQAAGREPSGRVILPGVLPWADYQKRRATWDPIRQCVGLDGRFWEGAEVLLYPPDWLDRAERLARALEGRARKALGIGIDPAEGGDRTAMAAVDEQGLIELVSRRTPDTNVIVGEARAFLEKHRVPPGSLCFDRGGGGKQHADRLRAMGLPVRTVAFGESLVPDPRRVQPPVGRLTGEREERYAYKNRRAQMYGRLRELLDPSAAGFALPADYPELRRQLAPIPLWYDPEGRLVLPPKRRAPGMGPGVVTLEDLIGHSPDEADALVLAVFAMTPAPRPRAGAAR